MYTWDIAALVGSAADAQPYAVVLLNTPIPHAHVRTFERIWTHASERICADGAANRLYDLALDQLPLPTQICGDLDSIRPQVRAHYEAQHVPVVLRPSQYATDLQKGIQAVEDLEGDQPRRLILFGGLTGRLDQTAHTLHVLWQLAPDTPSEKSVTDPTDSRGGVLKKRAVTISVSENSVTLLLPKGEHTLVHNRQLLGKTCGILPLGSSAHVSTRGLEWNLNGELSSLGGFLSTSNHLAPDGDGTVCVQTDSPVYWTVELKEDAVITKAQ
ncbi:ribonuclease Z [Malassezia cuniculi]|uniref:Thiamine pyrophosphokinase n=1 Tax=Malassezia cuniculi TaxID=948313 RepID=A0AAF0EXB2_9BASI|nr:ribonuclease Z [Malassezia cuniculi]